MGRYEILLKAVLKRGNSRILGALGNPRRLSRTVARISEHAEADIGFPRSGQAVR